MSFKPISYMQTDSRWKDFKYSTVGENTNLGKAGCGPTSAAMVAAEWADANETPLTAAQWSLDNGYKAKNQGTYYAFFTPYFKRFGLACKQMNSASLYNKPNAGEHLAAYNAVKAGNYVIACMGPGRWTSSGHFILWYGITGDDVLINDPNSLAQNRLRASWSLLKSQVKYYFTITRPENMTPQSVTEKYTVSDTDGYLNVRMGAGTGYDILGMSVTGTVLEIDKTSEGWARFIQDGVRYYVSMTGLSKGVGSVTAKFGDISEHWAEKAIEDLANMEIVAGGGDGCFRPDEPMTRAEAATMVRNAVRHITGK